MLSYGGVQLCLPPADVTLWVTQNISTSHVYDFERANWPGKNLTGFSFPGMTRSRPVIPNSLWWPTGAARWAVGYFFATTNQLQTILNQIQTGYTSLPFVMSTDNDFGVRNATGTSLPAQIQTNLYLLPPRPLAQIFDSPFTPENGLYLITLVDDRFFWWERSTVTFLDANSTWDSAIANVGDALGIGTIVHDPVPSTYLVPPLDLVTRYEYTPLVFEAIARSVGMRIVRGLDGSVSLQNSVTASALQPSFTKISGGSFFATNIAPEAAPLLPTQVATTFFATKPTNIPSCAPYQKSVKPSDIPLPDLAGAIFNGNTKVFHDSAVAVYDELGALTNQTELDNLAKQIAADWYSWQLAVFDVKYACIVPYQPEGVSDSIEWTYSKFPEEMSTRVQRGPWNDQTQEILHASPTYGSSTAVAETAPVRVASAGSFVQLTAPASLHDTTLTTNPIPVSLTAGQELDFSASGVTATLTSNASMGDSTLHVDSLSGAISNGAKGFLPGYNGFLIGYNESTMTWHDIVPVWVIEKNNQDLAQQNYDAELVGCSGGRPIYATLANAGGSSFSLTFENEDGSTIVSNVNTIIAAPLSNVIVTQPGPGIAKFDVVFPAASSAFIALLLDYEPNSHGYQWQEAIYVGAPGGRNQVEANFVPKLGGRTGNFFLNPAYEMNDNPRTPDTSVVVMYDGAISPASGSGLIVLITTSAGAVTAVSIVATGSGFPINSVFFMLVSGGGNNCIIEVTTGAGGTATAVRIAGGAASMGSGYSTGSLPTTGLGSQKFFIGDTTPFFIKITGFSPGTKSYDYVELDADDAAVAPGAAFLNRPHGKTGALQAYEVNRNLNVPVDGSAIVLAYWGFFSGTNQQEVLFYYKPLLAPDIGAFNLLNSATAIISGTSALLEWDATAAFNNASPDPPYTVGAGVGDINIFIPTVSGVPAVGERAITVAIGIEYTVIGFVDVCLIANAGANIFCVGMTRLSTRTNALNTDDVIFTTVVPEKVLTGITSYSVGVINRSSATIFVVPPDHNWTFRTDNLSAITFSRIQSASPGGVYRSVN